MLIESFQNEKVKNVTKLLADNRFRKKSKVFVVEGQQENERALQYHFEPVEFFVCENIFKGKLPESRIHYVSEKVYEKIAYRGSSEGILGIYQTKENLLSSFIPKENATVIIVEGVEKPGNLGAILRSCEAFGIDALIVADGKADFYNPNVIRSSVGCLFGMKVYDAGNDETFEFLQKNKFNIYTTLMDETAEDLYTRDFRERSAVLFGTEHSGLSDFWTGKGKNTLIPMAGSIDSLNLSNAVAITCYESLKQKKG
ncbi:RNA methyltransferase [Chryseobacterium carnipullorum]|uniref:RNA methyltransferase n=1 Tax=Chryseobacterium carnipullorum TaxID=1124835 RepID=A0A376EKB5_CHRCU|nr:RNA methyltransferase [Chryseobacterium carnipullorum]MDN5422363.1 RNA methyltransferase [Chryseobacterium sp.]AZA47409.1 RNA methyltransferase [Chryseobacterium carnipullorum]AZA66747.1 RNA methyltransferase [Chryseobacterium carnipullorum]MDN5475481.1 RNA methyltransferase [Chryseobacterium sp.]MDN5480231.1 RNA methyltransferase [Chryseobacterium sp.]